MSHMLLEHPAAVRWPAHDGESARLIRDTDWRTHPLGPAQQWPASLRIPLELMLPAQAQMVVFWGPEFYTFYNDAYAQTIERKHPAA